MEYQKIIKLLDSTVNQPYKLREKYWFEINDDLHVIYTTNGHGVKVKLKGS